MRKKISISKVELERTIENRKITKKGERAEHYWKMNVRRYQQRAWLPIYGEGKVKPQKAEKKI